MAKNTEKQKVRCKDCRIGLLLQWDNNPVIVNCRYLENKDVASTQRICPYYEAGENEIKKLTHYQ